MKSKAYKEWERNWRRELKFWGSEDASKQISI
jgi:hypothetical protein